MITNISTVYRLSTSLFQSFCVWVGCDFWILSVIEYETAWSVSKLPSIIILNSPSRLNELLVYSYEQKQLSNKVVPLDVVRHQPIQILYVNVMRSILIVQSSVYLTWYLKTLRNCMLFLCIKYWVLRPNPKKFYIFFSLFLTIASISVYLQCINSCQKISKRSVYERSKGWIYQSQISPVIDTMEALNEKIEQTQARYYLKFQLSGW